MHLGSVFMPSKRLKAGFMTVQASSFWNRYSSPSNTRPCRVTLLPLLQTQWVQVVTIILEAYAWKEFGEYSHVGIPKDSLVLIPTNWLWGGSNCFQSTLHSVELVPTSRLNEEDFFSEQILHN